MRPSIAERIAVHLKDLNRSETTAPNCLQSLIAAGLDQLPMPGEGGTLARWQALSAVAAFDLSLAKLYEGHTDALAILHELEPNYPIPQATVWGVWAAEAPGGRTTLQEGHDEQLALKGAKFWCSGALTATHALLTAWTEDGSGPHLVRIALGEPGLSVDRSKWRAIGMAESASVNVTFQHLPGHRVGGVGAYLNRPGFWQGGAGVAACWYGGALGLAKTLRAATSKTTATQKTNLAPGDLFRLAALGKVDLALRSAAASLREAAHWIDQNPQADASAVALRARLAAEGCAKCVLDEVGKALGATPFCLDEKFAQAAADLPVFIRQSHAERDFLALGERVAEQTAETSEAWAL